MAIVTQLARSERFADVDGCPLAGPSSGKGPSPCATCRFNIAATGKDQVGCIIHTPADAYRRALEGLRRVSESDHDALRALLSAQRRTGRALTGAELREVVRITRNWSAFLSGDAGERQVVAVAYHFAKAGLELQEPVRILE